MAKANLRRLGFCGADDSCDAQLLATISAKYPVVEWGVLLRPDLEGTPRYASPAWLEKLAAVKADAGASMRLAGHLCGSRVPQVLSGDASYVKQLAAWGFGRVQVNATSANGVDTSKLSSCVENLRKSIESTPEVEWIIQMNEETEPLWSELKKDPPANMSFLFDASCGKGVLALKFEPPIEGVACGYAGGMGPDNIADVLPLVAAAAGATPVWVDMESSLRATRDGQDVFSVAKCFRCLSNASPFFVDVDAPKPKGQCPVNHVAIETFVLGLALGAVGMYFVRRG